MKEVLLAFDETGTAGLLRLKGQEIEYRYINSTRRVFFPLNRRRLKERVLQRLVRSRYELPLGDPHGDFFAQGRSRCDLPWGVNTLW